MPQLNPAPWFMILLFSWLTLLTIVTHKTLKYTFTNEVHPINAEALKTEPWEWPW
uniref:ATP synthase complex subunit 8 n=1 Tax=Hoplosternum littorale TaxID=114109 RepID=A0A343BXT2_HOPLI|nr:ATP synthase F0 subunit 8 [Hoplosternum littorale]ARF05709.1 ATP synthase F0 subunit 8 [Hoplosternum littorale]